MADNITKWKLNTINRTARKEPSKLAVRKSLENTGKVEHTVGKVQGPNGKSNSS